MGELSHLDELEAEAIYIIREVAAECEKPVMLYSIGKDSSVMLHLAMKAFYPEKPPFPFLHVNTTWKFKEMIQFRDETAKKLGIEMLEYINEDGVKKGINPFDHGSAYTDIMKTQALKQALNKYGFTAAFGGGRRDEEKSRAKERIFSFRNENHAWDPKNQRPEMWYPDDFDIVILRERIFVQVRGRKVEKIAPLAEYQYSNVPVINGRGFAVAITSAQDAQAFLDELAAAGEKQSSDFFNKWLHFETYRKIIFKDEIWL